MVTQRDDIHEDISTRTASIREQLAQSQIAKSAKSHRRNRASISAASLHDELLELLDWLDERSLAGESSGSDGSGLAGDQAAGNLGSSRHPTVDWNELLDKALASWQAQIATAFHQSATRELSEHLKQLQELCQSQKQREEFFQQHQQELERRTADLLQREARLERQRRTVGQQLRAARAEMLLEIQCQREQLLNAQPTEEQAQAEAELLEKLALAELLRDEARQELQQALDELASRPDESQTNSLEEKLSATESELRDTLGALRELEAKLAQLECDQSSRVSELEEQLSAARETTESIQAENERLWVCLTEQSGQGDALAAGDAERITQLEDELADLREQNRDLAAKLAKRQVVSSGNEPHVNFDQQSLSWEERKQLIMRQLESECEDSDDEQPPAELESKRLEIERVLNTTQMEIDRRNQEIAELKSIIEQQSDTRQGVAIGAAAIGQMLDTDELIQQERQKLKEIQAQWEEKLRQAEIDVSMERAKLARERLQLDAELEAIREGRPAPEPPQDQPKKRKWLEQLGLRPEG